MTAVVAPWWCAMVGGGRWRDGRAMLLRCIVLSDPLPVHAQLSLRSRRLTFFTSPLLLNHRLRPPSSQSQRHIQVLLSTMRVDSDAGCEMMPTASMSALKPDMDMPKSALHASQLGHHTSRAPRVGEAHPQEKRSGKDKTPSRPHISIELYHTRAAPRER